MLVPLLTTPLLKIPKYALVTMLSVLCREIYRSCKALIPSILYSYSGKCLSVVTISTSLSTTIGPILVSFLDRRRGREKLNKEAGTIEEREESYDLRYHHIRLSKLQADLHILGILVISVSALI
jgi:hypothetical protein